MERRRRRSCHASFIVLILGLALVSCGCVLPRVDVVRVTASADRDGPRVLCIVAHPDDEIAFAGLLYKTATYLHGTCDVVTITNGEGGFKYSTLAEVVYDLELTDEEVGRAHLPRIRRAEMIAGCSAMRVSCVWFLGECDHRYTRDEREVLAADADVWRLDRVRALLRSRLAAGYDLVLVLAPTEETHGHHKAAAILALEAVAAMDVASRPVILCVRSSAANDAEAPSFSGLAGYPVTRTRPHAPLTFDRTQAFGYKDRLNYKIIADWAIAAHRSQGTMQLLAGRGDVEHYFLFDVNRPDAERVARAFFDRLAEPQFYSKTYGPTAGTDTGG